MMKKFYLLLCGALLAGGGLYAQSTPLILKLPDTALEYDVLHLSSNGKWACGVINNGGATSGWLWNLTSGELTELTPTTVSSTAQQVSDNGVVAGTFPDSKATANGAEVESSGYWQDGRWNHLATPGTDNVTSYEDAGTAAAISPDGRYIGGQVLVGGMYTPVIWDNGKMTVLPVYETSKSTKGGAVYSVDNEGHAAGWTYYTTSSGTTNRSAALWLPDLTIATPDKVAFWYSARMSYNGRYAIAFDRIYDTQTKTSTAINFGDVFDYTPFGITDDGIVFGYMQTEMGGTVGCFYKDGAFVDANQYLKDLGAQLDGYSVYQVNGVSSDGKTFAVMALDMNYMQQYGMMKVLPLVLKFGENLTTRCPAGIDALPLEGANAVKLYWHAPLAGADGVKSYELYRDGGLIKTFDAGTLTFTDTGVPDGEHAYTVKAVYAEATSDASDAANVTVGETALPVPRGLMALQARVNDVRLMWDEPANTLPSLKYYSDSDQVSGLGWGGYSIECANKYTADMLAAYGESAKIEGVTFFPMSRQKGWTVNIYDTLDTGKPLYSETVDATSLVYGQMNTVKLSVPFAVPQWKDLIVSVLASVDESSESYNVMGRVAGKKRIGYTDLLRRPGIEDDFYSMYESSMSRGEMAQEDNTTWPIGLLMSDGITAENAVTGYKVWADEIQMATVNKLSATFKDVKDGTHTYSVAAVFADGKQSEKASASLDVTKNLAPYNISNLKATANGLTVTATWNAPVDDDASVITYATGNESGKGVVSSKQYDYAYSVGALYSGSKLKAYSGYEIKALKFFPINNAHFNFVLTENGKEVATKSVESGSYTLGQWNTVNLDNPVALDPDAEYLLALECTETEGLAPIGIDLYMAYTDYGDLYKQGTGGFGTLSGYSDVTGNWMIGMEVGTPEPAKFDIKGYNVKSDNTLLTASPIKETSFDYTYNAPGTYQITVTPVYDPEIGNVEGQTVTCTVSSSTGLDNIKTDGIRVYPNPATTYLKADGNVSSITAYTLSGAMAAYAEGNTLDVSGLGNGIYIVKVKTPSGLYNTKVMVRK